MNIFFYAAQESAQAAAALEWLCSLRPSLEILVLPSGSGFSSHVALELRSGDLIILFVRDQKELEALVRWKSAYSNFKIFCIFQGDDREIQKAGHLLNARYYTFACQGYIHAEETIRKIVEATE